MSTNLITVAYIIAAAMFILGLSGLSSPETARRGNLFGVLGMIIALVATAAGAAFTGYAALLASLVPAVIVGAVLAARVKMTSMPQLVALLHSFVGAAAVLVGFATWLEPAPHLEGIEHLIHNIEIYIGVAIGAITFTGSVIACLKLDGRLSGKPLLLPARHLLNLIAVGVTITLCVMFTQTKDHNTALTLLLAATLLTGILGAHMVMAIGGADMPVVVSMLNSYSGWAAAAAGFMLANDLLIVTGALVGSSGAILSLIMCRGMNRSFISVLLGGFGVTQGTALEIDGEHTPIDVRETVAILKDAKKIVIVPGYGMAVARAQHSLARVVEILRKSGVDVTFAIHPVAGRLPGHMNVLLAEANVPYDIVLEMDEVNSELKSTDAVLVIGANDIVNPSALEDPNSQIAGMPVLEVWNAEITIVMKRSLATGYAGIQNPLFFRENARMLFGDAGENVDAILKQLTAS
jgi:NAD(P) transhydrogenase subunit beta